MTKKAIDRAKKYKKNLWEAEDAKDEVFDTGDTIFTQRRYRI